MLSLKARPKIKPEKVAQLKNLISLIEDHEVIAVASLQGLRAKQMQELRRVLKENAIVKVAKNTLMKKAVEQCSSRKKALEKLISYLKGQNTFIFTNENPFSLALLLEKHKVLAEAKPGDIAPKDIIINAGNTGITPGPLMSKFSMFKVPVKIEEGSIWVTKDTVVAKKGDAISADLAELLKRLNIKPMEVKLKLKVAYFNGQLITAENLYLDLKDYREKLIRAHRIALALSLEASIVTSTTAPLIIGKAVKIAKYLASEIAFPEPTALKSSIRTAYIRAFSLAVKLSEKAPELNIISLQPTAAPPAEAEKREEEKKKEEEKKEEEVAEGLAALFGPT
ncbi:MAG: 50S ribosomal protein L10 [archaeon GB-1845-036]|nr:50S ribosomal protein L10 [Candidatus Culexmicrobium thermophilum]